MSRDSDDVVKCQIFVFVDLDRFVLRGVENWLFLCSKHTVRSGTLPRPHVTEYAENDEEALVLFAVMLCLRISIDLISIKSTTALAR
jgi:hypothetical protein